MNWGSMSHQLIGHMETVQLDTSSERLYDIIYRIYAAIRPGFAHLE